jgi:hypothetical protein
MSSSGSNSFLLSVPQVAVNHPELGHLQGIGSNSKNELPLALFLQPGNFSSNG